ncbi:protein of unknown function DUF2064 [Thioalkalivibrio nitratireducens DSM 14787]|uniref:Glycosyltransferase n=1 Tax=Thioalkalivibrio nitratireducens (strain DSM 14787 / UNIQEM 213 / ALEN2) TaxID=1255043 RepID=L0DZZ2_THIND|nr:TIGR04282 family arsenosugar biosynthesis glycosyltransferase [Thioalkalivibrio nitratireducens]AGA34525.1 protein of unknown function DUF2064 [Thioalkalivibrio nitratireducens DSM 14787]
MRLLVFAKAPEPGQVKTRLIPALGAEGAARLHRRLVRRVLAAARASAVGPVELWAASDARHPFFAQCRREFGCALRAQLAGDLGQRMSVALHAQLPALLVGSDAPGLDAARLQDAAAALVEGGDAVLIPALDGGYVAIGLAVPAPGLFTEMPWGGAEVLQRTVDRCREQGLRCSRRPPCPDVDRPDDLIHCTPDLLQGVALVK